MLHVNTLDPARTLLLIIDMQEAFRSSIPDFEETAHRIAALTRGALLLNLPVLATEQYPKGLGHTAGEIKSVLPPPFEMIEKTAFSSCGAEAFSLRLQQTNARQILVCGIEAHICVNQTVHDLLARGYEVHIATDCITSRSKHNREVGLRKMQQSGAIPSTVEMALFELMRDARHEQFKAIQKLIK